MSTQTRFVCDKCFKEIQEDFMQITYTKVDGFASALIHDLHNDDVCFDSTLLDAVNAMKEYDNFNVRRVPWKAS